MSIFSSALLLLTAIGITASAVLAFWWAGKSGQFESVERGSMSVFDADEIDAGQIEPEGATDGLSL